MQPQIMLAMQSSVSGGSVGAFVVGTNLLANSSETPLAQHLTTETIKYVRNSMLVEVKCWCPGEARLAPQFDAETLAEVLENEMDLKVLLGTAGSDN